MRESDSHGKKYNGKENESNMQRPIHDHDLRRVIIQFGPGEKDVLNIVTHVKEIRLMKNPSGEQGKSRRQDKQSHFN